MSKKKILLFSALTSICVGAATFAACNVDSKAFSTSAEEQVHSIRLDSTNLLTTEENSAKAFTRQTAEGNDISFVTFGGASFGVSENNFAIARDANAWFYNTTPMHGLTKVKFKASSVDRVMKVYFGNEEGSWIASSEQLTGSKEYSVDVPRFENPICYVKWQQLDSGNNWMNYFEFEYSCSATLADRGSRFDSQGKGFEVPATDIATGVITTDIKWTDLGPDDGKVAIQLMKGDWSAGFGYKTVRRTSATGDIPGLTVSTLSDGYTRYSWKLSEMTGGSPSEIGLVHIRADWTTSEGYCDVNADVNVIEYYGSRFEVGVNKNFNYDSVDLSNHLIVLDVLYDKTTDGSLPHVAFYICNNSGCGEYYGNFQLDPNGVTDKNAGTSSEMLDNGYIRYTFDPAAMTKSSGTKPTASIYSYFRGAWSTASGLAQISFVAK